MILESIKGLLPKMRILFLRFVFALGSSVTSGFLALFILL